MSNSILSGLVGFVGRIFGKNKIVAEAVPVAALVANAVEGRVEELLKTVGVNPDDVSSILTGIENIVVDELTQHGKLAAAAAVSSN